MSYVESQLLSGETVIYRAHRHKMLFALPVLFSVAAVTTTVIAFRISAVWPSVILWLALAAVTGLHAWIVYTTSEFCVTNKRVVMKVGFIRRRSLEMLLSKIEVVGVDQSLWGRMFDFGSIDVTGTGGTHEPFRLIASPLEFRRQVQDVVSRLEDARSAGVAAPAGAYTTAAPREERDCPFCAERILVKAKVCKYCGRDVSAMPAAG